MSTTVGRGGPERSPGLQPFSYAEAAKGRTISIPAPQQAMEPPAKSPASISEGRRPSATANSITNGTDLSESISSLESASNQTGSVREAEVSQSPNEHDATSTTASTITSPTLQTKGTQDSKPAASGTSSPSFGTASTSTLPKEEDVSFTPNGSSDSTWDKQSQVSNSAEKSTQTGEGNQEKMSDAGWEYTPSGYKELKPAPIPTVNFWQQRKAAQDAKAKATVKSAPAPLSFPNNTKSGSPNLPPTSPDPTPDQIKTAPKKRGSVVTKTAEDASSLPRQERRRTTDGGKPRDEGPRRPGPRPSRSPDKEKTAESNPPPPVGDAESWPTPDLAQDGSKRRTFDRTEKNDNTEKEKSPGVKPHGKEKWVPVPYVPTAIFATPLPTNARRGGARGGGRGGREVGGRGGGHAPSNSIGGEKAAPGSMMPPPTPKSTSNERGRNENTGNRAASLPAQSRRATSADAAAAADQRKTSQPIQAERSRGEPRSSKNTGDLVPKSADAARFPNNVSDESGYKSRHESRSFSRGTDVPQRGYDPSLRHPSLPDGVHAHPRYQGGERRGEGFVRPSDFQREPTGNHSSRERGEPRSERGRGGYRGRGNYNGGNSQPAHHYSNPSLPQQTPPSFTPSKSHSYNERPYTERGSAPPQSATYGSLSQQSRTQRPNIRSQSIPTATAYQQYPNGTQVPAIQTDLPSTYGGYPSMYGGIMSAMPYQPFMADYTAFSMVQMQMDYYFSVDNLCKDMYLRKHMDSQGFVPLHVIANFRRIKALTDNLDVLRMVCRMLKTVELRTGEEGIDRIRKIEGWEQWILKMDERDPSAQNDGPAELSHQLNPQSPQGYVDGPDDVFSPTEPNHRQVSAGLAMSPASMQGGPFPEYASPMMPGPPFDYINGMMQTPLNHATPEFVPNFPPLSLNDTPSRENARTQPFPEHLVDNVMIVVRKPDQAPSLSPQPNLTTRTLSQGSINEQTMEQSIPSVDGRQALSPHGDNVRSSLHEEHGLNGIRNPGSMLPSPRLTNGTSPGCWVKEGDIPTESLDDDTSHEPYSIVRTKALAERQLATEGESSQYMIILYNFWSHFLVDTFISPMYKEFRTLALEDQSTRGSTTGLQHLIRFYDATLTSPRVITTDIAEDYVELVKNESQDENRPAFHKLRAIWRNGAFNLKSRKMIDNHLDQELRTELEE